MFWNLIHSVVSFIHSFLPSFLLSFFLSFLHWIELGREEHLLSQITCSLKPSSPTAWLLSSLQFIITWSAFGERIDNHNAMSVMLAKGHAFNAIQLPFNWLESSFWILLVKQLCCSLAFNDDVLILPTMRRLLCTFCYCTCLYGSTDLCCSVLHGFAELVQVSHSFLKDMTGRLTKYKPQSSWLLWLLILSSYIE